MAFRLHAEIMDPTTRKQERGTGILDDSAPTRKDAIKQARQLREQGFTVTIRRPDGEILDEQGDE